MLDRRLFRFLAMGVLTLVAAPACANPAVPVLTAVVTYLILLLIPILILEALVARWLLGTGWGASFRLSVAANLYSTLVGTLPSIEVMSADGMDSVEAWGSLFQQAGLAWRALGDGLIFCFMFYLAAVLFEWPVAWLMLDEARRPRALRWVLVANLLSYLLILPFSVLQFRNWIIPTYEARLRHPVEPIRWEKVIR